MLIYHYPYMIEAFIFKGYIFYSLYLMLSVMLIRPFVYFLNVFNGPENEWINLCCYSNYIYRKWIDAYYPKQFWVSFLDIRAQFDHQPILIANELRYIFLIIQKWEKKPDRKVNLHVYHHLIKSPKTTFYHRIRLTYYCWTNIK